MPLDSFVDHPAERMEMVGKPKEIPPVQAEVQKAIDKAEGKSWPMGSIERFAFYERAKKAYCVIVTGETPLLRLLHLQEGRYPAQGLATHEVQAVEPANGRQRPLAPPTARHAGPSAHRR